MIRASSPLRPTARLPLTERLKRLAASAWFISLMSFAVSALIIQSSGLIAALMTA
jgi:hypothetical protein